MLVCFLCCQNNARNISELRLISNLLCAYQSGVYLQETDSRPHTPLSIKSDTSTNSDKNNNGDTTLTLPATESSQTTAHDDSQTLQCYCSSDDVIVLSKQVDILQARLSHFSR